MASALTLIPDDDDDEAADLKRGLGGRFGVNLLPLLNGFLPNDLLPNDGRVMLPGYLMDLITDSSGFVLLVALGHRISPVLAAWPKPPHILHTVVRLIFSLAILAVSFVSSSDSSESTNSGHDSAETSLADSSPSDESSD